MGLENKYRFTQSHAMLQVANNISAMKYHCITKTIEKTNINNVGPILKKGLNAINNNITTFEDKVKKLINLIKLMKKIIANKEELEMIRAVS